MFKTLEEAADSLSTEQFRTLAATALEINYFKECPGGSLHHHAYKGGLYKHTLEVVNGCAAMCGPGIDKDALLAAAIWHDVMKTKEYVMHEDGKITSTEFRDKFGHVVTSANAMLEVAVLVGISAPQIENMYHSCLAHHGRKEWGSPAEPRTPEAWILHSNDMLSSRGLL